MHELDNNTWILEPNNIHSKAAVKNNDQDATARVSLKNNFMSISERKILLDAASGVSLIFTVDICNPNKVVVYS